jgi:hypothetical protein
MDAISVRCKTCKHAMKFSAEKAGKRAKCPKCDAVVLIAAEEMAEAPKKEAVPESAPAAPVADEEDDGPAEYGVWTDPEIELRKKQMAAEEEERRKKKKKKKDKDLPSVARKIKAIPDAEAWNSVRLSLLFTLMGVLIWGFTHVLQCSYVLLGSAEYSEYGNLINKNIEDVDDELPERGEFWKIKDIDVYLGMIAGKDLQGTAKVFLVVGTIFYFFQALSWGAGNVVAMPVPRRFGMFGQLITGLILGFFNFLIMFIFKLLPVLGVGYLMIPFVTPEIDMTEYNMERIVPLHVMWSAAPFWDTFATIIFRTLFYLQPMMSCVFIWSVGTAIKDEGIEKSARGMTQLCLGVFFMHLCYHFLAMCGATPVMVIILRVFYGVWFGFTLLLVGQYALLIVKCRAVLYDKIYPRNELVDEAEE